MVIVVIGIWIISPNRFPAESVGPVESGDPGEIVEADTIIQPVSSGAITSDTGLVQPPDNRVPDETNLVNNAATSVAILELSKSLRGFQPFDRQLQTVTAVVSKVGGLPQVKILLEFVEMYALQGVPGTLQLSELIPALRLEVEVFSGLESRSFIGELFYSALALASDDAKLELQRADKTRAIFVVAKNQLSEGSIEGAIVALSHLEPTQKEVALSFIESELTKLNSFPMPFLKSADYAAEKIYKGLTGKYKFEIFFPWFFIIILKLFRILPYKLYFFLINKFTKL